MNASRRRCALALLLVAGGGMMTFILLPRGEQGRVTPTPGPPQEQAAIEAPPEPPTSVTPPVVAAVAPSVPLSIRIDAIGASAPVDPLGLNADGTLEVPQDYSRAGYYTGRPTPGATGPAIIVAHVDSKAGPAVFYRLRDLKAGDEVVVARADRSEVVFVVDRLEQHPKDAFPTEAVYAATPGATLRLITCGGSFDKAQGHYRDNLIAYAHLKG